MAESEAPSANAADDLRESMIEGVPLSAIPRHIAMIMDGNGRWASRQGKIRVEGHLRGAETVRLMTEECTRLGIEQLTLYCLSSENWKRPAEELEFLMELLKQYLREELGQMVKGNVRLRVIGRMEGIPGEVRGEIEKACQATSRHDGICLCLAINYGGRQEIVDATRRIVADVREGRISESRIDENLFGQYLYTCGMPDPDLLVRTAGEMRISNYLLWQISYSELWVTEKMWPELTVEDLHDAIRSFSRRERRFGGLKKVSEKM